METHKIKVAELTQVVRSMKGTPFHHGGRVPGAGLDCGGMMVVSLRTLGYTVFDKPHYNRHDGLNDMLDVLAANSFSQKDGRTKDDVEPGDLILIRSSVMYHHLVYFTEDHTVIHAWFTTGCREVAETTMPPEWWGSIHSIWRFDNLEA